MNRIQVWLVSAAIWGSGAPWLWAACSEVTTVDFVGTVCLDDISESRSGQWIVDDAGVFEGTATIRRIVSPGHVGHSVLQKGGSLRTPQFEGSLTFYQERYKNYLGEVVTYSNEALQGRENLANGGVFNGTANTYKSSIGSNKAYKNSRKYGTLKTPGFDGTLSLSEYRYKNDAGAWITTGTETHTGTWILAPDEKLIGTWTLTHKADGTSSVNDARRRVVVSPAVP